MLGNQKISRRLVLSARQLYFFQKSKEGENKQANDDLQDSNEENKFYVLGYN